MICTNVIFKKESYARGEPVIDVKKIAQLARLSITSEEEKMYGEQMSSIFKHFEEISAIDTKDVEPLVTPTDMKLVYRHDKKEVTQSVEDAMKNAPEKSGNLFKVPPVVG
jgi:aspartyl-tRNA(Asn)/glutamyl-tRNA(Gln) amidotransferase subunit C